MSKKIDLNNISSTTPRLASELANFRLPTMEEPSDDAFGQIVRPLFATLDRVVLPVYVIVKGEKRGIGTAVIVGGGPDQDLWAITASHVLEDAAKQLRPGHPHPSTIFYPDSWDSLQPALNQLAIQVDYKSQDAIHSCPVVMISPNKNTDVSLILVRVPTSITGAKVDILNINSDDIEHGRLIASAGYLWRDGPKASPILAIGNGGKLEGIFRNPRTGAPSYRFSAASYHGMSGGPILAFGRTQPYYPSVAAIISGGLEGDPKTDAVSVMSLYGMDWEMPIQGCSTFPALLEAAHIRDCGEDRHLISVVRQNGKKVLRRRSRLVRP